MARQPQGLKLDPDGHTASAVISEPVQIRQRSRLGLPAEALRKVAWLKDVEVSTGVYALGLFHIPGRILLKSWEAESVVVLAQRRSMELSRDPKELALFEDVFRRLQISRDGRITFTMSAVMHLGVDVLSNEPWVIVTATADWIEVTSLAYRNSRLEDAKANFADTLEALDP